MGRGAAAVGCVHDSGCTGGVAREMAPLAGMLCSLSSMRAEAGGPRLPRPLSASEPLASTQQSLQDGRAYSLPGTAARLAAGGLAPAGGPCTAPWSDSRPAWRRRATCSAAMLDAAQQRPQRRAGGGAGPCIHCTAGPNSLGRRPPPRGTPRRRPTPPPPPPPCRSLWWAATTSRTFCVF